jgi:hypothetical protein
LFGICPSNKRCPSARCAYAGSAVDKDYYYIVAESIMRTGRLCWLQSVNGKFRIQPKKYFSKFTKNVRTIAQIKSGDNYITEPQLIAEACAEHFRAIFNYFFFPVSILGVP